MGSPIVSTDIGVEGIALSNGEHFARANSPDEFVEQINLLLNEHARWKSYAEAVFAHASKHFGAAQIAQRFQDICLEAIEAARPISLKQTA